MPSLLARVMSNFKGWKPAPGITPAPTVYDRIETVKAMRQVLEETPRKARPSASEKVPGNYSGGIAGKVWFLPYFDSATKDSPEIRAALRIMNRDPYVKAAWEPQLLSVASQDYQIQPAEEGNAEAEEQAQAFQAMLEEYTDGGVPQLVRSIAAAWGCAGHSLAEPVWGVAERGSLEGKIVAHAVKSKDTDSSVLRLEGDQYNNVRWVHPLRRKANESFPIEDFIFTRYMTVFDEPLGQAAYRSSYGAYWSRDTVRKLRIIHCEKKMSGTVVGTFTDEDTKGPLETALERLKSSTWITIPEGTRVEAVQNSLASETDYKSFDESLRDEIVTGIAFATLQIVMGNVPDARGDSKVQKAIFELAPWLIMVLVQDAVNKQLAPKFVDYNYAYRAAGRCPKLTFGAVSNAELLELLQIVQGAQGIGLTPSKKYYTKSLSIQQADPNDPEDALTPASQGFGGMGGFGGGGFGGTAGTGTGASLPPGGGGPGGGLFGGSGEVTGFAEEDWTGPHRGKNGGIYWLQKGKPDAAENRAYQSTNPGAPKTRGEAAMQHTVRTAKVVNKVAGHAMRGPLAGARLGAAAAGGIGRGLDRVAGALANLAGKGSWLAAAPEAAAGLGRMIQKVAKRRLDRLNAVSGRAKTHGAVAGVREGAKRLWEVEFARQFVNNRRRWGALPAAGLFAVKFAAKMTGYLAQQATRVPLLGPVIAVGKEFLGTVIDGLAMQVARKGLNTGFRSPVGRTLGLMKTKRNPNARGRVSAASERWTFADVPAGAAADPLGLVIDLRQQLDEAAAAEGGNPVGWTDEQLAEVLAELLDFAAEKLEAAGETFAEIESFSFQAARSRTGTTKAVGTGEDAGEVLYGDDAEAALAAQGKTTDAPHEEPGTRERMNAAVKQIAEKAAGGDREAQAELLNRGRAVAAKITSELESAPPLDREAVLANWETHARDLDPQQAAELAGHFGALADQRGPGMIERAFNGLVGFLGKLAGRAALSVVKSIGAFAKSLIDPPLEFARKALGPAAWYVGSLAATAAILAAPVAVVAAGLLPWFAGAALVPPALVGGVITGKTLRKKGAESVGRNFYPGQYGAGTGRKGSVYEGDPRIQNPVSYSEFAESDVALAGPDGKRAAQLLSRAQASGTQLFADVCGRAVMRLLAKPDPFAEGVLFDDAELSQVREGLSRVIASADLLGRVRIRRRAEMAEKRAQAASFSEWTKHTGKKGGTYWLPVGKADTQKNRHYGPTPPVEAFAEGDDDPFHDFAEPVPALAPAAAVEYFKKLVPTLGASPVRYGPALDRYAFTLAAAADQTILEKVKAAILESLETGANATPEVQDILDAAGVGVRNPQYAEAVVRSNVMDSYNQGAMAELAEPEMREAFPAWEYHAIADDRARPHHAARNGKLYPSTAVFADVRGHGPGEAVNCRCCFSPVSRRDPRLNVAGAIETRW